MVTGWPTWLTVNLNAHDYNQLEGHKVRYCITKIMLTRSRCYHNAAVSMAGRLQLCLGRYQVDQCDAQQQGYS